MHQERFRLDIRKYFFSSQALDWAAREVIESPSLEVFRKILDVVLREVVYWEYG